MSTASRARGSSSALLMLTPSSCMRRRHDVMEQARQYDAIPYDVEETLGGAHSNGLT